MIAFAAPADGDVHHEFEVMFPALQGRLRRRFRRYRPDRRDEFVAEATAMAWMMFLSACRRGKDVTVGTLATFAGKAIAAGRRLAGMTDLDALSDSPRAQTRVGVHVSLPETGGGAATRFEQVFGDHRWRWPVLDVVAPAMDLQTFLAACDGRDRRIVAMKSEGHQQIAIAAELGISPSAVCLRLGAMRRRWDAMAVA